MAKASQKKTAQANIAALKQLHITTLAIFGAVFALQWFFGRSLKKTIIFSIPMFALQYFLEKSGRPKYNGRDLVSCGNDLSQGGLTEYMHDVIYFTWILLVLSLISMKFWYLLLLLPAFAAYKAFQLLKAGKKMLSGGGAPAQPPATAQQPEGQPQEPQQPQNRRQRRQRGSN